MDTDQEIVHHIRKKRKKKITRILVCRVTRTDEKKSYYLSIFLIFLCSYVLLRYRIQMMKYE